jgi:ADP-ribose pyrophosphatase YjhB (NUDIX family)
MSTAQFRNPFPTVDIIIEINSTDNNGIVLISRKNPPFGWAIPGGFVDYGESLEEAAIREAKEETSLDVELIRQFHTYSHPARDPRHHTISTVFIAKADGIPLARDDAADAAIFSLQALPEEMAFDHKEIILDYITKKY